ncbi:DUF1616 domain-containing protein [Natronocalculus amylovorans]|uniref:DUF1616 domain-containing protein n=1 Tax=Natronocalculus amylovorans TaxID=2917812 RepID=A0AAE3FZY7_9EURY|nr:DUF1616 domain-containing protein [Natronocalculus amylovorans]MCL9818310.1 DUF1616 domain-containing protein [Natronocalculus amylovorans]
MASNEFFRMLVPREIRQFPPDLAAVVVLTVSAVAAVFLPVINLTPIRIFLGVPFVLFLPGYALIAALFPEAGTSIDEEGDGSNGSNGKDKNGSNILPGAFRLRTGIDGIERAALSFGTSIAVIFLIGLLLSFTPWGIRLVAVVLTVAGFTILTAAIASFRRWSLPEEERFVVPYREWISRGRASIFDTDSRFDGALNAILAISVLLAVGSVAYAVAVPPDGEQFSEIYLLTEDSEGELVADGYPQELVAGESESIVVGIENQEHETTEYTVIVEVHQVEFLEDNEVRVTEQERVTTLETTLEDGETWQAEHEVASTLVGEDLRVTYLLYTDDPPDDPTRENAYRSLHFWIDVTDDDTSE